MKFEALSKEDQALLNTKFPEELEKEASAEVGRANELYAVGFEKMASGAADELDKSAEEEEEEEKKEKPELDEDHKKEAAARGAFIARGYVDGLKKLGQERHQDELHYFYPALEEKLGMDAGKLKGAFSSFAAKAKDLASKAKAGAGKAVEKGKAMHQASMAHVKSVGDKSLSKMERTKHGLKALHHPGVYGAGAAAAAAGAHRALKKKD
jgi:hypothetical protein